MGRIPGSGTDQDIIRGQLPCLFNRNTIVAKDVNRQFITTKHLHQVIDKRIIIIDGQKSCHCSLLPPSERLNQQPSAKAEGLGLKSPRGQVTGPAKPFLEPLAPGTLKSLWWHQQLN
jgi:hypothetical protein